METDRDATRVNRPRRISIRLAGVCVLLEACIDAPIVGLDSVSDPESDDSVPSVESGGPDAARSGTPPGGGTSPLGADGGPRVVEAVGEPIPLDSAATEAGAGGMEAGVDPTGMGGSSSSLDAGGSGVTLPCPSTVVNSPPLTSSHGLVYDARRELVLLVAGAGAGYSALHAFDTARRTWVRIEASDPAPSARAVPGFAYDYSTGRSVLFGGTGEPGTPRDLWEWDWDQCRWLDRTPAVLPPEWPSFRWAPGMTYDYASERVIITTGIQNPTYQWETDPADATVYEWDSASATFNVRPPAGTPPFDRGAAVVVSDPHRRLVYLFSGLREDENPNGTGDTSLYVWDGSSGSWSRRDPNPAPSPREFTPAYFDLAADRLVTVGGLWYGWLSTPEHWQYDPEEDVWSLSNTDPIYNRFWSPIAYDEKNAVAVQFGGLLADPVYYGTGPTGPVGDTRVFTGATVTQLLP